MSLRLLLQAFERAKEAERAREEAEAQLERRTAELEREREKHQEDRSREALPEDVGETSEAREAAQLDAEVSMLVQGAIKRAVLLVDAQAAHRAELDAMERKAAAADAAREKALRQLEVAMAMQREAVSARLEAEGARDAMTGGHPQETSSAAARPTPDQESEAELYSYLRNADAQALSGQQSAAVQAMLHSYLQMQQCRMRIPRGVGWLLKRLHHSRLCLRHRQRCGRRRSFSARNRWQHG